MNRRAFLGVQAASLAGAAWASSFRSAMGRGPERLPRRGVSLAGPEFGGEKPEFSNRSPGEADKDYTYNSERAVEYFCDHGLNLLRLPIRWERIQPKLGDALKLDEAVRIRRFLNWARKYGGQVVLDIHNYGRYAIHRDGKPRACIIDESVEGSVPVSREHFCDLWSRLARTFGDDPTVYGYGLMNEPHDMGSADWKRISQEAVDAIRDADESTLILVAGDEWSSALDWVKSNGPKLWINDPSDRIAYEAHCYFDRDHTGQYKKTFAQEKAAESDLAGRAVDRLNVFVEWCKSNGVKGFLGEFGVPNDEPGWEDVLKSFLEALDRAGMDGCYWAGGEWWDKYRLSIHPDKDYQEHKSTLRLLKRGKN